MKMTSFEALLQLSAPLPQFDLIFIDASLARDVMSDAALPFPLLKVGGILILMIIRGRLQPAWYCRNLQLMHSSMRIDRF